MAVERVQYKLFGTFQDVFCVPDNKGGPDRLTLPPFPGNFCSNFNDRVQYLRLDTRTGRYRGEFF